MHRFAARKKVFSIVLKNMPLTDDPLHHFSQFFFCFDFINKIIFFHFIDIKGHNKVYNYFFPFNLI